MAWFSKKTPVPHSLHIASPQSSFGYIEAYKALRTNLNYVLDAGNHGHVLMVTSSVPAEGKSNVAVNLAAALAQDEKTVVLLDLDLRKGTLHRYLQQNRGQKGVCHVLCGECALEDALVNLETLGISALTTGFLPPNPTELLGSEKMRRLLETLAARYDYVICDTAPVNAVADTCILSRYADGAILVVGHDQVTRENVLAAKQQLEAVNTTLLGVVLNRYDARRTGADSTRYDTYYNSDYGSADEA